jgi:hypothetical protein
MKLRSAIGATLKSKRFWVWQVGGVIIYAVPVIIRFATKRVDIPFLNFPGFWIDHFIPGNFLEKILVNSFFPGGAGGVAGETFFNYYKGEPVRGKTKYVVRLGGALLQTVAWSAFQFWGYSLSIKGPWGGFDGGNIFEHTIVFPINFVLATFSIFTPEIVNFAKSQLLKAYRNLTRRIPKVNIAYSDMDGPCRFMLDGKTEK